MARSLSERMIGAATLDVSTYEEVEHDLSATGQAALVVALVAIASAIGAIGDAEGWVVVAAVAALVGQFIIWLVWAGITYLVGTSLFGGTATWGELLRTLGFAQAPGVLYALGFIPILGGILRFVVGIWILIAGIVAIRQALDVGTGTAVLTALVGWVVMFVITLAVGLIGAGAAFLGGAL